MAMENQKRVYYSLYDRLLNWKLLYESFKKVKSSKGAGGIDGQNIDDFEKDLKGNLLLLLAELKTKSYKPHPVLRKEIKKEDGTGTRKLGLPTVRDKIVQQALLWILTPIFEEDFHPSSYGYRPNKSCHQAISKATVFMRKYGLKHVVDMDLSKCFDTLKHDMIINTFRKRVTDGSILNLIRLFLESGVMIDGKYESTEEGSPQGGVISPLIANVYLNEFDQYMKSRNCRIVRYADDILIFCRSEKSAKRLLESAEKYLEEVLMLKVNRDKTHVTDDRKGVKFLGTVIFGNYTIIQEKKIRRLKEKIRKLTQRNGGKNLKSVIRDLNPVLRGFSNYFKIANCNGLFDDLD